MDTSDEWIKTRTGISRRHIAVNENTADLCTHVAQKLLAQTHLPASAIDMIIVATMSPDAYTPSTAAIVQGRVNAKNAFAFDVSAACSGFVYALDVAAQYMANGDAKAVMVIGGEVQSKLLDWSDRSSAVLFGDGAGGVILQPTPAGQASQFLARDMRTFGNDCDKITAGKLAPLASFPSQSPLQLTPFSQDGRSVYRFATHEAPASIKAALAKAKMTAEDIDWFVLHQANVRILQQVAKRLKVDFTKFVVNIDEYGNTCAASEPLALYTLANSGKLKRGDTIVMCGYGAGLTVGTQIIKY